MNPSPEALEARRGALGAVRRLAVFLVVALSGVLISRYAHVGRYLSADAVSELAAQLGPHGILVLVLAGALTPLLFLPRWPIAFLAGLLYGVWWGTLLATLASTVGAWLHFLLSRTLLAPASERIRRRFGFTHDRIPKDKQFVTLLLLRAFPLSSFVATNVLAGALKLNRNRYLWATFLGMLPSSWMYAAWGKLMKKPDPHFYVMATLAVILIVAGSVAAQRYMKPWFRPPEPDHGAE